MRCRRAECASYCQLFKLHRARDSLPSWPCCGDLRRAKPTPTRDVVNSRLWGNFGEVGARSLHPDRYLREQQRADEEDSDNERRRREVPMGFPRIHSASRVTSHRVAGGQPFEKYSSGAAPPCSQSYGCVRPNRETLSSDNNYRWCNSGSPTHHRCSPLGMTEFYRAVASCTHGFVSSVRGKRPLLASP
jgi:hypothetical protein